MVTTGLTHMHAFMALDGKLIVAINLHCFNVGTEVGAGGWRPGADIDEGVDVAWGKQSPPKWGREPQAMCHKWHDVKEDIGCMI